MSAPAQTPNPTTEAYFRIGQVASIWSLLERLTDETIWLVAKVDGNAGACITAQVQSLRYKLSALISLCELRGFDDLVKELKKFSSDAEPVMKERNHIIHTPVVTTPSDEAHRLILSAERKLRMVIEAPNKDAELKTATDALALVNRMLKIREDVTACMSSL